MIKYFRACFTAFLVIFLVTAMFSSTVFADQESAQTAISSAKTTIKNCYEAAKEAETAGAKTDSLMVTLNDAAGLLSKAELAYASNKYDSAFDYASQSKNKLNDFIPQAASLKETAIKNENQNFIIIVFSLLVSAAVFCVGIAAWIVLNKKERKRLNGPSTV